MIGLELRVHESSVLGETAEGLGRLERADVH